MPNILMNPATWTMEQWLIITILVFIVVAIAALIYRLIAIVQSVGKKRERPNLRPNLRPGGDSGTRRSGGAGDNDGQAGGDREREQP